MSKGVQLIAEERQRQVEHEGWTAAHDDQYDNGELVKAAQCYSQMGNFLANYAGERTFEVMSEVSHATRWPWEEKWWKPSKDPLRNLAKAGALIAAEMDRILRQREEGEAKAWDASEDSLTEAFTEAAENGTLTQGTLAKRAKKAPPTEGGTPDPGRRDHNLSI